MINAKRQGAISAQHGLGEFRRYRTQAFAPTSAGIAAAHQVDEHQLDSFFIGEDGALYMSWVIDGGTPRRSFG
jgi:hypothetical protein